MKTAKKFSPSRIRTKRGTSLSSPSPRRVSSTLQLKTTPFPFWMILEKLLTSLAIHSKLLTNMIKTIKNIFSEEYAIYELVYQSKKAGDKDGNKVHIVTKPIDLLMFGEDKIGFKTYSFGRGVRKFLDYRVVSMNRIHQLPDVEARPYIKIQERVANLSQKSLKSINEHLKNSARKVS